MHRSQSGLKKTSNNRGKNRKNENILKKDKRHPTLELKSDGKSIRHEPKMRINKGKNNRRGSLLEQSSDEQLEEEDKITERDLKKRNRVVIGRSSGKYDVSSEDRESLCINNTMSCTGSKPSTCDVGQSGPSSGHKRQKLIDKHEVRDQEPQVNNKTRKEESSAIPLKSKTSRLTKPTVDTEEILQINFEVMGEIPSVPKTRKGVPYNAKASRESPISKSIKKSAGMTKSVRENPYIPKSDRESPTITKSGQISASITKIKTEITANSKTERKSSCNTECSSSKSKLSIKAKNLNGKLEITPNMSAEKDDLSKTKTEREAALRIKVVDGTSYHNKTAKEAHINPKIVVKASPNTKTKKEKTEASENVTAGSRVPNQSKTKAEVLSNDKLKNISPYRAEAEEGTSSNNKTKREMSPISKSDWEIVSHTNKDTEMVIASGKSRKSSSILKIGEKLYNNIIKETEITMKVNERAPLKNKKSGVISNMEKEREKSPNMKNGRDQSINTTVNAPFNTNDEEESLLTTKIEKKAGSSTIKVMQAGSNNDKKHSALDNSGPVAPSSKKTKAEFPSTTNSTKNASTFLSKTKETKYTENSVRSSAMYQQRQQGTKKTENSNISYEIYKEKTNCTSKQKNKNAAQDRKIEKYISNYSSDRNSVEETEKLKLGSEKRSSSESSSEEEIVKTKVHITAIPQAQNENSTSDKSKSEEEDSSSDSSEASVITEKSINSTSSRMQQMAGGGSIEGESSNETSDIDGSKKDDIKHQSVNKEETDIESEEEYIKQDLKDEKGDEIVAEVVERNEGEEMERTESNHDDEEDVSSVKSQENGSGENETEQSDVEDILNKASTSNSESDEKSEEEKLVKAKDVSLPKRKPLPSCVKAKLLHIKLGTPLEERENIPKCGSGLVSLIKHSNQLKAESEKTVFVKEQMSVKRGQHSSTHLKVRGEFKPLSTTPNHHLTAQTHIITNLRKRQREARENLLSRGKETQHVTSSDVKPKWESFPNKDCILDEQQSNYSTVSSLSSNNRLFIKVQGKTRQKKHKLAQNMGTVVQKQCQDVQETSEDIDTSTEEKEDDQKILESSPRVTKGAKPTCSMSAFRRVTGWLQRVPPKKSNLKERLASVARAIGFTDWLFRTFRSRKKLRQSELKRKTAMRLLSTSRIVNQVSQSPIRMSSIEKITQESVDEGTLKRANRKSYKVENNLESSASSIKKLCEVPEPEETTSIMDAKYAIVFPRIHHLAKTIKITPAVQRSTASTGQRVIVSVQPATSNRRTEGVVKDSKHFIQNQPENSHRSKPLQLMESRSNTGQVSEVNETPQGSVTFSKVKPRKEDQDQSNSQILTPSVAGTTFTGSEVGSSFVGSRQDVEDKEEKNPSYEATTHVHWAQSVPGRGDPTEWLSSETLLPHLTIENLSKWTMYQEVPLTKVSQPIQHPMNSWEAEDSTEDMLQMSMNKKQTSVGHMLLSVNPFKSLNNHSLDMAHIYQDSIVVERPPHIFAVVEEAYTLCKNSEHPPNILLSGYTGSGKTETVKVISQYITTPQRRQGDRILQLLDFLMVLESFGNAKTVLNSNSTRFGQILQVFLQRDAVVGCSVSQYLLEKSRVVFQALGERGFHIFYELLQGLPEDEKQGLYLQEPETYYYLNQGRACDLPGKNDKMDFMLLDKYLRGIGISDIQLTSIWAILSAILQLGNICFTSFHRDNIGSAAGFRITEIRIVASLLQISPEGLQKAITQRVTMTSYDQVLSPLTVEASIDVRDAISQSLYGLLFDWLLEKGNDWLCARETDSSLGIIDICGFENLGVNSLEQLCRNFANEQLQCHCIKRLVSQEQAEYAREGLCFVPPSTEGSASCLGLLTDLPHGILHILKEQTELAQATDHTFLQKCHYHHGNSSCYIKPKLPLPVFTLQHYSGPVTYQVHNFLSKNRDRLPIVARDVLAQSRLKLLSDLFKRAGKVNQPWAGKSQSKCSGSTLTGRFQLSLQELSSHMKRSQAIFVRCISPNPKKLPGIFDVEFVSSQLRNSGILKAVKLMKNGYPIRTPLTQFVNRYGHMAGRGISFSDDRESCAAVLTKILGDSSSLYQIGISKVFLKERGREILQRKLEEVQSLAALTLQKNLRGLLNRKNFQAYRRKITVVQAHVRGHQARRRYRRLKHSRVQFGAVLLISRIPSKHRRTCQLKATGEAPLPSMDLSALDVPAKLAAVLNSAQAKSHAQGTQITEVPPPQVKVQCVLSLAPDINNYPFSIFIRSYFKDPVLPPLGQPLENPLTRVSQHDHGVALELYKLALRFMGNITMPPWQQRIIGNYIVERCLRQPSLKDEVLCQAASLTVQNNNEEQNQRAWLLLSGLFSSLIPSPTLEKPLLKYVSDQGFEGYKAICQSKMLRARKNNLDEFRSHAPTLLEWTANERKGKMVMDVFTYNEEKYSTEVDSWTTAEQLGGWLLKSRGVGDNPRGWSVSILDGDQWFDLSGDDFLMDVIAVVEDGAPSNPFETSDYPFGDNGGIPELPADFAPQLPSGHPSFPAHGLPSAPAPLLPPAPPPIPSYLERADILIPPAPTMQAPPLPPSPDEMYSLNINGGYGCPQRMENYLDQLFNPVLSSPTDLERSENLNFRMKGGGGIGPTRQNAFSSPGYTGIGSMPSYSMPMMNGMMPPMGNMPVMPTMPGMMPQAMMPQAMMPQAMMPQMMPQQLPMPQPVVPAVDPTQLAAQQQAFIQQQALLLAQQMTLQATMLSQQQQPQRQDPPRHNRAYSPPRVPKPAPKPAPKPTPGPAPTSEPKSAPAPPPAPAQPPAPPPAPTPAPAPAPAPPPAPAPLPQVPKPESQTPREVNWDEVDESEYSYQRKTFQQKREFFQQMVAQEIRIKSLKPPSKILLPTASAEPENDSDEEPPEPPEPEPQPEIPSPKPPQIVPPPSPKKAETPEKEPKKGGVLKPAPRPQPSREIRDIIKMYQNRPQPEPRPFEPVRRPIQTFLKKKDPKEEALERLQNAEPTPSSDPLKPPPPPPPAEKTSEMSDSIREKQKPLLGLFQSGSIPPVPTGQTPKGAGRTLEGDHTIKSSLSKHTASVFFSYSDVSWRLYVRKEIFYPKEKFTHPYYLNLLCEQIIRDTFSETSFKLTREERKKMRYFLNEFQVGSDASSIPEDSIKKRIVLAARDNWDNYFSRLFPVTLDDDVEELLLGVSHRGFRLLKEVNATGIQQRHLKTLCSYSFADLLSIEMSGSRTLRFCLRNEDLLLQSDRARALKTLVEIFLQELVKDSNHVVALRSHITDDKSLLYFKKGDIIKVLPMDGLEPGWQFGSIGGRSGLFPSRFVQPAAAPDYYSMVEKRENRENRTRSIGLRRTTSKESGQVSEEFLPTYSPSPTPTDAAHYTMVEFALKYFREAQTMLGWKGMAAEGKKPIELVQHTKVPIQESLIYYTDKEMNDQATNNFMTLMRFMGDQQYREQDDVKCIYEILLLCREKPLLRDEVYCQVLKQITENPKQESCNRGWILLSLLTGYFLPSPTLLPCVTKYLQDATGTYQEISRNCQEHLRHTVLYHGRRHLPPRKELEALLSGRVSRRLMIILAGGAEYTTKIKTFTVAADLVPEICEQLLVSEPSEVEEFAIFANKNKGEVVRPLCGGEYIHDFLLQDNSVTLEFRRVTWKATLRGRSELYVQVHYSQVRHDFMQGKALLLSSRDKLEMYAGTVAALLHRIKGMNTPPDKQELLGYIPASVQNRLNLQVVQQFLMQELRTLENMNIQQAKVRFLETVSALPLFEYNVFFIKRISEPGVITPCFVAVNHQQLLVLENNSQQPYMTVNLQDIQSMRTMRPLDSNTLPGVELHYGTSINPHTLWMDLQEAKELYHTLALIIENQETAAP